MEIMRGGVNEVVRVGATVRRPTGHWTPNVHALLTHLERQGFTSAPRVHGIDDQGREVLSFVPGETADYPLPEPVRSDAALVAVARLLRRYHDACAGLDVPRDGWYFPAREPVEVVCHGDVAPYNVTFDGAEPQGLIDFDTAHPGPRIWDVAGSAYRFVPLTDPANDDFHLDVDEQRRRLALFCDTYGVDDRVAVVTTAVEYLRQLRDLIRQRAADGDPAFATMLAEGHDRLYDTDLRHVQRLREGAARA